MQELPPVRPTPVALNLEWATVCRLPFRVCCPRYVCRYGRSENVVALRIAQDAGLRNVIGFAQQLGVESELVASPGLTLGESVVTPLEITGAFCRNCQQRGLESSPRGGASTRCQRLYRL